jgi:sodium/hydrogen exchanger 8
MSGIVSIIFCGISMARYALPNLDRAGLRMTNTFYHSLAYGFENSIFIFIGIGFTGFNLGWSNTGAGLIMFALLATCLGRYLNIRLMTAVCNHYRRISLISREWMTIMFFSGMRGAMAFALSLQSTIIFRGHNYGNIMLNITLFIVIVNVH